MPETVEELTFEQNISVKLLCIHTFHNAKAVKLIGYIIINTIKIITKLLLKPLQCYTYKI